MQDETGKNKPERDAQGRLLPGSTANPNGRPKGSGLNLTSLLKEKLEELPVGQEVAYKEVFIKTLLHKALVEKDLQSLKLIINYVDGLPKQSIDLVGEVRVAINGFNYVKPEPDEPDNNPDNNPDNQAGSSVGETT